MFPSLYIAPEGRRTDTSRQLHLSTNGLLLPQAAFQPGGWLHAPSESNRPTLPGVPVVRKSPEQVQVEQAAIQLSGLELDPGLRLDPGDPLTDSTLTDLDDGTAEDKVEEESEAGSGGEVGVSRQEAKAGDGAASVPSGSRGPSLAAPEPEGRHSDAPLFRSPPPGRRRKTNRDVNSAAPPPPKRRKVATSSSAVPIDSSTSTDSPSASAPLPKRRKLAPVSRS